MTAAHPHYGAACFVGGRSCRPRVLFDAGAAYRARSRRTKLPRAALVAEELPKGPTMAALPSVLATAHETEQSIQDAPAGVRLLIQSYEPSRVGNYNGAAKPYVRAILRGADGAFAKTRGATRDADGTARWFEAQTLDLDLRGGRLIRLQFLDEAGRSAEAEVALGPLVQAWCHAPHGVLRRCVTCVCPTDELEPLSANDEVRYARPAGVLRFGVVFLQEGVVPSSPAPPRVKARVRIRFEASSGAVVKAALGASGKAVECALNESRTVVLRSSHAEIDVLCISCSDGELRVPLGFLPDGRYPTEAWTLGDREVFLSIRMERATDERPPTPASPCVPTEPKAIKAKSVAIATSAKRVEKTVSVRCSLVGVVEDNALVDCDRWRLVATLNGQGPRKVDGAALVFDAKRHSFLDIALGRTSTHSSFVGDGATQIHAPLLSLDALCQVGGECVVWLPLNESHAELGVKPHIGVRLRVNGPRSFKRKPFRGWVHCVAICQQGPLTLSLDGHEAEMPGWPAAADGVVLPLSTPNEGDAETIILNVALGDAVGALPLTTSILDGGDVASATLDLDKDDMCISTARVTVQALPGETLLQRKLASPEAAPTDSRQVCVLVKAARFLEHPRCRGWLEPFVRLSLRCGDDRSTAKGSISTRGTDTHPQWAEAVHLSLPRALALLLDARDLLRHVEPPSIHVNVAASTMPTLDNDIGGASCRVPWEVLTYNSAEEVTLELRDAAGAFRGEVDLVVSASERRPAPTRAMLFLATDCKAPLIAELAGRKCSSNALWPLSGIDDEALIIERCDGAGCADLSNLAARALAHPGALETCEDTLGRGHQASHVTCRACVVRPATGSLEVMVEELDLDEEACKRAASLTDGENDAPKGPSQMFCRVSVQGASGHGAFARSQTSLVGKHDWRPGHAERLSLHVDSSGLIDDSFAAPALEIAVLDERGGWRNRVARGSVALAPLIALKASSRSKAQRGIIIELEDPVTGAARGRCTLSTVFNAFTLEKGGAPAPSTCAAAALLKKAFFDAGGGPSKPTPRAALLEHLNPDDAPWTTLLDASDVITWDAWRDVVACVSTRADLIASMNTAAPKKVVKPRRGGGPGVAFSLAFSAANATALKTDAARKAIATGALDLVRGVDGRVATIVGSSCAVAISRTGFDADGVKKVLVSVDVEAPLGAAVLRLLGPCTLENVKIGTEADRVRRTTEKRRAWDRTLQTETVHDDAKTRAAIAGARDARRALRREKKVLEAVVCAGGGRRAAAALLLAAAEAAQQPPTTPTKGRSPSTRRTPPSSRRSLATAEALSPSSVWVAHAREGAAMERESLVNEVEALKAQAEESEAHADGFKRVALRAADDLEGARRRDAEAEAWLRAAETARRRAAAALEARDAEVRELRGKERADKKASGLRRDYTQKAALRATEALKEQDTAARVFQRRARPFLARKKMAIEREDVVERKRAASTLVKRRRRVNAQRQEKNAATCVQKTYRGLTARRAVTKPAVVAPAPRPAPAPALASPPTARPASPDPITLRAQEQRAAARRAGRAEDILRTRRAELRREAELRAEQADGDRRRRAYVAGASCLYRAVERAVLRRCREVFVSWRRGGVAPTAAPRQPRQRRRRHRDDREAYRRADAARDLEAERAALLQRADVARARADAEEARLRAARREADAAAARLRELERRRHDLSRASPPATPRRDASAPPPSLAGPGPATPPVDPFARLVVQPEPAAPSPQATPRGDDDSFPSFRKVQEPPRRDGALSPADQGTPRGDDDSFPSFRKAEAPEKPRDPTPDPTPQRPSPAPTPREWPPFGRGLIGAGVKVNIKGVWLSAEIVEVGAAMAELDGVNGVCIRFTDGDDHAESEEWHEYGTDEIAVLNTAVKERGRPPFGEDLVGAYVQAHVAGAWLDAVVVEVEAAMADHDGKDGICIQYADYPTADPEWHLYASEDILYREDPPTPEQRSLVDTPERLERVDETPEPDSPRVIRATPTRGAPDVIHGGVTTPRDRPASPPGGIYHWY